MTDNLPTDTYYRGYRLSELPDGDVLIYWMADHIDTCTSKDHAKALVDDWLDAP